MNTQTTTPEQRPLAPAELRQVCACITDDPRRPRCPVHAERLTEAR